MARQMRKLRNLNLVSLAWASCIVAFLPSLARAADKKEIIRQAREAYYNVKAAGLVEFRCQASPDWDSIVKAIKPPPADPDQLLPLLRQLHFGVAVGPDGGAVVSHQFDGAPPSQQMAARLSLMTTGADQVLNGFFQSWTPFVFGSAFPESNAEYELENADELYRLHQKQGSADVVVTMTREFVITEIAVKSPQLEATIRPQFSRNNKGYLLSRLGDVYKIGPTAQGEFAMDIRYQEVEGFTLPAALTANVTVTGSTTIAATFEINFVNYHVTKQ